MSKYFDMYSESGQKVELSFSELGLKEIHSGCISKSTSVLFSKPEQQNIDAGPRVVLYAPHRFS